MTRVTVRAGRPDDLPALTEIYNHYVINTPATFDLEPFTVEQRQDWFGHYSDAGAHRLFVAADDGRVLGYATSSEFRAKRAYATSVETTIYLHPDERGRGVGRSLYSALFRALAGVGVHRAYAGIAQPNEASMALHAAFGFAPVGTFREVGRKFDRWWDVTWLEKPFSRG